MRYDGNSGKLREIFTFQYVSINTDIPLPIVVWLTHLHSNMFLLIQYGTDENTDRI